MASCATTATLATSAAAPTILVNQDCSLKICDFGLARWIDVEPDNDPVTVNAEDQSDVAMAELGELHETAAAQKRPIRRHELPKYVDHSPPLHY
jgi:serine/threonine protein kinase